jgi:hypothetical protein
LKSTRMNPFLTFLPVQTTVTTGKAKAATGRSLERDFCRRRQARKKGARGVSKKRSEIGGHEAREMAPKTAFVDTVHHFFAFSSLRIIGGFRRDKSQRFAVVADCRCGLALSLIGRASPDVRKDIIWIIGYRGRKFHNGRIEVARSSNPLVCGVGLWVGAS